MTGNFTPIDDLINNKSNAPPHKESEPIGGGLKLNNIEMQRVVEHKIQDESVKPYVEEKKEEVDLPPDLKKMGLQAMNNSQFPTFQNVKLPISDDKVILGSKAPITSSLRWLSALAFYLLSQAHLTLKVVHGHVIRVMRRG